ncbi:UNVERIFIED_CONTAM: hypothetical protein GTU68_059936 [Idotea baltica]|nr:hypothetical protein [Idotea baltica]
MRRRRRQCYCNEGYVLNNDQVTCSDLDECKVQSPCQGVCTNTVGSFECKCGGGNVLLEDGVSCGQESTSCAQNNGGCEQTCRDKPNGGVRCRCTKGYELNQDKRTCSDVDECASGTSNCKATQVCKNTIGSFECTVEGEKSCDVNNGGCEQRCRTNRRGFVCACRRGFELQADGKSCKATPGGCSVNKGGCQHRCRENQNGVVQCSCRNGFDLQADGKSCTKAPVISLPVDPCQTNNGGCDQICVNKNGSPACECREGFVFGNGFCQQQNPCQFNNGGCEQICRNNNGIVICECNLGFLLNNGVCQPLDPCQFNNGGCDQLCVNRNGNVACECHSGFIFANGFCQHHIQPPSLPIQTVTPKPSNRPGCGVNTKKSPFEEELLEENLRIPKIGHGWQPS